MATPPMTAPPPRPLAASGEAPPSAVVVDLDGTLIAGDLLWEGLRLLLREQPLTLLLRAPFWLLRGRAAFKAEVAARVTPDPLTLAYRPAVLAHTEAARRRGATVVLASASPRRWVEGVARQLELFDHTLASDGERNLAGAAKLAAIRDALGDAPFEYLGDRRVDLPIWRAAAHAISVAPSAGARRVLASLPHHHELRVERASRLRALLRALRPHQWAKNGLIFVPILLAHELGDASRLRATLFAFLAFCAVASAGYVLNDLLDADADRAHPTKRHRPIASGDLSVPGAFALLAALVAAAVLASGFALSAPAAAMVAGYGVLTCAYSFYFKQQLLLDVLVLAGLYTYRVLAGGVAAEVPVSPWLLAFSSFFFLSLALVKRYVELRALSSNGDGRTAKGVAGRAYQVGDVPLVEGIGLACGTIAVLVLCLYISSDAVSRLYAHPERLWLMCPVMFYWVARVWLLAHRGELHDDPVLFATTDRSSYLAGLLIAGIVVAATY